MTESDKTNHIETGRFNGTVRPLQREDILQLKPILETWLKDSTTGEILPDEVAEDIEYMSRSLEGRNQREYLVAETAEGKVVGMIGLSPLKQALQEFVKTERPIELVNAYVDKDYREGRGVGSALVNKLTERAKEKGFTEILLDSGPRYEHTAWGFYDKQPGFQRVGIAKDLYGPGGDAPVWQRLLTT